MSNKNDRSRAGYKKAREEFHQLVEVNPDSAFSVADEAADFLFNNYASKLGSKRDEDFVAIFYGGKCGKIRENGETYHAETCFTDGDLHALSHCIANAMVHDPKLEQMVFHALAVYSIAKGG